MSERIEVEFTDRYGGYRPPWNYCRGGCDAMGVIPVKLTRDSASGLVMASASDRRLPMLAFDQHKRGEGHEDGRCDGWHFVQCPDCGGSGEIAWWRALRYLPGKAWRTLFFVWDHGVRSYSRPPWMTWREQMVTVLRIAVGKPARR